MEARMGHDFGQVRVHADGQAASLSRQLGARAFTHGQHVYFGASQFAPETQKGRGLLAHELVHVVQQSRPGSAPAIQRSAIAHFETADFEARASAARDKFEQTMHGDDFYEGRLRRRIHLASKERKRARFEKQISRVDPDKHAERQDEARKKFGHRPGKLNRRLRSLERKRNRAAKKVTRKIGSGGYPTMQRVMVIAATYHYVPVQQIGNQRFEFSQAVLDAVQDKFRVGSVWPDLNWKNGEKIGVRFDIEFQPHKNISAVQAISGETPGVVPMRAKAISTAPKQGLIDYTAPGASAENPRFSSQNTPDNLGEASFAGIDIDTETIRNEEYRIRYYERDSDRREGISPQEDVVTPTAGDDLEGYMASIIAHEIGHNIGMIHHDLGIMATPVRPRMKPQFKRRTQVNAQGVTGDDEIIFMPQLKFPDVEVQPANVQALLDRIDGMSVDKGNYWNQQRRSQFTGPPEPPTEHSGFTVLKGGSKK
jgi:hypothetical protein